MVTNTASFGRSGRRGSLSGKPRRDLQPNNKFRGGSSMSSITPVCSPLSIFCGVAISLHDDQLFHFDLLQLKAEAEIAQSFKKDAGSGAAVIG